MTFIQDRCYVTAIIGLLFLTSPTYVAATDAVVHWKNGAAQNVGSVLSGGGVFTTDFKGANDAQVTLLSGSGPGLYDENFAAAPGNNPAWITSFVGNMTQGTGSGTAGVWTTLNTSSSTNSVQFDFSIPLAAGDRILIADVDNTEKYQLQAYAKVGLTYVAESMAGWLHQNFSGWTGIAPDARWATWDSGTGYLTATGSALSEPLSVFTVNQSIDRIVFYNPGGGGGTPTIQFASTIAGVPGDYNNDGVVDAADYVLWRNGGPLANEVDAPGTINSQDYTEWRSRFGNTSGSGALTADVPVPEPGIGGLIIILGVAAGFYGHPVRLRDAWRKEPGKEYSFTKQVSKWTRRKNPAHDRLQGSIRSPRADCRVPPQHCALDRLRRENRGSKRYTRPRLE